MNILGGIIGLFNLVFFIIMVTLWIYLLVLIIKALRKYINQKPEETTAYKMDAVILELKELKEEIHHLQSKRADE